MAGRLDSLVFGRLVLGRLVFGHRGLAGLILGLVMVGALAGCSPSQYFAQPGRVEEVTLNVRDMKAQQAELAKRIEAIEALLTRQQTLLARNSADQNAQLDALTQKLREISNRIDEIKEAPSRQQRVNSSLYPRPVDAGGVEPQPAAGDSAEAAAPPADPQQLYDAAYKDVTRGNWSLAVSGFREFLRLFPENALADNAQYWLGECAYTQGDIPKAVDEFQRVVQNYPKGEKVPAALLKLGYCSLQLNDKAQARKTFEDLIKRFEDTEEARAARQKLASMN